MARVTEASRHCACVKQLLVKVGLGCGEWPPWRGEVDGDDDELKVSFDRQNARGADTSTVVPPTARCKAYGEDHD